MTVVAADEGLVAHLRTRVTAIASAGRAGVVIGTLDGAVWRVDVHTGTVLRLMDTGTEPVAALCGDPPVAAVNTSSGTRVVTEAGEVCLACDDVWSVERSPEGDSLVHVACAGGDLWAVDVAGLSTTRLSDRRSAVAVSAAGVEVLCAGGDIVLADAETLRDRAAAVGVAGAVVALTTGPHGTFLHSSAGSLERIGPPARSDRGRLTVVADRDHGTLGRRDGLTGWCGGVRTTAGMVVRFQAGGQGFRWAAESAWNLDVLALSCGDAVALWDLEAPGAGPRIRRLSAPATGVVPVGGGFGAVDGGRIRAVDAGGSVPVLGVCEEPLLGTLTVAGSTIGVSRGGELVRLGPVLP